MRQDYNFGMIQLCHKIYIKRIMHYETPKDPANHKNPKHLKLQIFILRYDSLRFIIC